MRRLVGLLPAWLLKMLDRVPIVVVTRSARTQAERNAFTLGRDYERGQYQKGLSTVAAMLSAIQEHMTTRAVLTEHNERPPQT